jgi:hypothetical protein
LYELASRLNERITQRGIAALAVVSGRKKSRFSSLQVQDGYGGLGGSVEQPGHENDYLSKVDSDAEGWAESERERELMAVLVEAAHLRSAARAWYRAQGVLDVSSRS